MAYRLSKDNCGTVTDKSNCDRCVTELTTATGIVSKSNAKIEVRCRDVTTAGEIRWRDSHRDGHSSHREFRTVVVVVLVFVVITSLSDTTYSIISLFHEVIVTSDSVFLNIN